MALHSGNAVERDEAWRELFDRHFRRCYRLICQNGVLPADAEELTQKAFLVAHRRMEEVGEVENVGAWLHGIALKVVAEHYRWRKVRKLKAWMLPDLPGSTPAATITPEADASGREQRRRISHVMGQMSAKLREVLVLLEIEGLKPQEASEVLKIPVNTVRSRRRLAVEDFRKRWMSAEREKYDVE